MLSPLLRPPHKWVRWILLVMGLLALPPNVLSDPDCSSSSSQSRYKSLVCWLWQSKIILPNEQFKEEIFTININDMTCTKFQVASMKSSSTPSSTSGSTSPNPSFAMDLEGMSASCTGKYALGGIGSGNIVASVSSSGGPSLHMQVDVASKPLQEGSNGTTASLPFPTSATISSCQPNFLVHDVKFSGSVSAKVIGLFSGVITKKATASINENLCALIKQNGEGMLNRNLQSARKYIGGLILNDSTHTTSVGKDKMSSSAGIAGSSSLNLGQPKLQNKVQSQEQLLVTSGVVTWDKDMAFLKRLLAGMNKLMSQHMNEGIILKSLKKLSTWQSSAFDCEDCGFFFKGINGLIKSLTNAGSLEIPIPKQILNFHNNHTFHIPSYGDVILTVQNVKVSGLDNLTDLILLNPSGQNLLSSSIGSDAGFDVTASINLEVRPAKGAAFQGDILNESFELSLSTSHVYLHSSSAWEFDQEIFNKLSVGSFIYGSYSIFDNNPSILNCIIEALSSITLLDMRGIAGLDTVHISPVIPANEAGDVANLESNMDDLINNVLQLILSEYPKTTTEALAGLISTPMRNMLNDGLANLIGDTKKMPLHCANVDIPKYKAERPLRFDSNRVLTVLDLLVNGKYAIDRVNSFIGCVDNVVETNKLLGGHFFNFSLGTLDLILHDLNMENTDSVYELELLKPEDHYHLSNTLGYGMCASSNYAEGCDTTGFSFGMNLVHKTEGNLGNVNVHVDMKNLKLEGGTELHFDMNYLPFLSIKDMLSHPQCLSIPMTGFDIYGLNSTIDMLEVKIDVNLSGGQNGNPRSFTYKTDNSSDLAAVVSHLLSKGAVLLQDALGDELTTQLNQASGVCETPVNPHQSTDGKKGRGLAGLWTFLIVLVFVAINAWLFLRGFKSDEYGDAGNERANNDLQSEEQQETSLSEPLLQSNQDENEMDEQVFEVETPSRKLPFTSSSSLMYHPSIHPAVKYGFPVILVMAFILFLSSNLTIGASVDLLITRADGTNFTSPVNVYAFSLWSTMREMAQAGVYLLMLLILFCSGVWPYVKLILMLCCWVVSTRRLPPVRREKILYMLDSLGKFSLIDAYVLVLMMVAFRYHLEVEGVGAVDVYVTPYYGFFSFLFATIISLISGHCMLFAHRRTMMPDIPIYSGRRESLSKHIFDDKHGRGLVKLTKRFRRTILLMLLLAFVLICVGVGLKSYHFKFNGVAGTALGDDRVRSFSLVSIGEHIPHSVHDSSSFGIYWIQTCYFFFALVTPLVCLLSMFALFLVPMRLKQQQKVFMIAEVANAWSAIEVFVIAIVASLLEISPFAESMVSTHCSLLNQLLSGWSGGSEDEDLHYCFDVKSSIDASSAVLIIGVILNSLIVSSLHRFAHHAIWERIEREDRPDATDDENKAVRESVLAHTFVSRLRKRPRLGAFMFEEVSFGPHSEYDIDFENVTENEEGHTSNNFWSEWTKIVSVI